MRLQSTMRFRRGFTLVELMISAAITVLIMTILSICFQVSMRAMGGMRAQGEAAAQLRAVGEVMKQDIRADHFLPVDSDPSLPTSPLRRGTRLSDFRYDVVGSNPPTNGFFRVVSPPSIWEGRDGFDSYRSPSVGVLPLLWFTAVLPGVKDDQVYSSSSGGGQYSECVEVAYILTNSTTSPQTPGQVPLFDLRRRQRLVSKNDAVPASWPIDPTHYSVDTSVVPNRINSMRTLVSNANGVPGRPASPPGALTDGSDIILSNVISFEVKPTWVAGPGWFSPRQFGFANNTAYGAPDVYNNPSNTSSTDAPFDTLSGFPAATYTFDTIFAASSAAAPRLRITGVQVRLRIYDPKARTARQSTFVFDL